MATTTARNPLQVVGALIDRGIKVLRNLDWVSVPLAWAQTWINTGWPFLLPGVTECFCVPVGQGWHVIRLQELFLRKKIKAWGWCEAHGELWFEVRWSDGNRAHQALTAAGVPLLYER